MKSVRLHILIAFVGFAFSSCKEKTTKPEDFYYDYFPVEVGSWVTYDVEDTRYDVQITTETYQLKELIESETTDNQGRPSLRMLRYWRTADSLPWEIKDVWLSTRTKSTAEKVEENIRYVKLIFPVRDYQTWDGNIYNNEPEWEYFYDSINEPRAINNLTFDETVKVVQAENFNLIQEQVAYEIYAKNVGLVYRKLINLEYSETITTGRVLYQTVTGYGKD
ncbi:MAG: hypothetical protein ACLGGV_05465 [Bacteroidia bacterium]